MNFDNKIKNVAIYLRKSRNNDGEETEATLLKHRNRLLEIANKHNWKYELFQEIGSSMNENRPKYVEMCRKLNSGIFDAVLSVNMARVTRDDIEVSRFMKLLREQDIYFITDSERPYNLNEYEDLQAIKFNGFFDFMEYEGIKARFRKGKKDSAKMGRWSNGVPNYGYIYNPLEKKLEIDENKAEAVRLAFQLIIDDVGVDNISIELNKLGYRTNRGNHFHGNTVKRMIQSEIYKGWIVSNKLKGRNEYQGKIRPSEEWIIVKDAHPPIIDEKTWDKANKALQARRELSPRAKQRRHGLSSIIKCANCGRTHSITNRKDRKTNTKVFQPCNKKDRLGVTCSNRGFNYNAMMTLIISRISEHREEIKALLESYQEDSVIINSKEVKLKKLDTEIKKVQKALDLIQLQLEEGLIDMEMFKMRTRTRNEELVNLQNEFSQVSDTTKEDEAKSISNYLERLERFLNEWQRLDDEKLNKGLLTFIDKIIWSFPKGEGVQPTLEIFWK
ncbi:hypothetical protein A2U94_19665 [Bacillus sp. VT 712]|uniref:recombinase family protein n=1 Tax=Bacillaceae TaxID=186817 RepID=UPI0007A50324|nr:MULTISPECIES: recombinase family protein [Bacillaceae]KZB89792.1 hypothetical protein A2U94_19665 [Bacillus sp. VT 712]